MNSTKAMKAILSVVAGSLVACGGQSQTMDSQAAAVRVMNSPKLLLSHIACTEDDTGVDAHFVLLFAGSDTPDTLSGTYSGGQTFGPVAANKHSGNVWHYDVILPSGDIDIESAAVGSVTLQNPDVYSDHYECGGAVCDLTASVTPGLLCTEGPLGSESDECGYFGLDYIGKDTPTSSTITFTATEDAALALVKTGSGACGPGNASYEVYLGVSVGDVLASPVYTGNDGLPTQQAISHVTYCRCAPAL